MDYRRTDARMVKKRSMGLQCSSFFQAMSRSPTKRRSAPLFMFVSLAASEERKTTRLTSVRYKEHG